MQHNRFDVPKGQQSTGRTEGRGWPVPLNLGVQLGNNHVIILGRLQHLLGTDLLLRSFFTTTLSESWSLKDQPKELLNSHTVFITKQALSALGLV